MRLVFRLGSPLQDISSYVCKYSKIQKTSNILNTSGLQHLDKGWLTCVKNRDLWSGGVAQVVRMPA
jgi:hypothetical protein